MNRTGAGYGNPKRLEARVEGEGSARKAARNSRPGGVAPLRESAWSSLMRRKVAVPRPRLSSKSGFTLVEVSAILSVLAVLSVILVPQVRGLVQSAQRVRAANDLQAICNGMLMLVRDLGSQAFTADPSGNMPDDLELLVSSGDIPESGPSGDARWLLPVNGGSVDFLDNFLVTNTPGGDAGRHFPNPLEAGAGNFAWRGSYMGGPLPQDPWGNRYMVNVGFLKPGSFEDVVVYSAGPNEKVETEYARDGLAPGGDDLLFLLARDGGGN